MSTYGASRSESLERAGTSLGPSSNPTEDDIARNRPPTKPKYVRLSICQFSFPSGYCVFITGISFVFCRPSVSQPTVSHSTAIKKPTSSGALSGTLDNRGPYSCSCHSLLIARFFLLCVGEGVSLAPTECTVVTFTFGDEPVPYRSRIPGRTVTLKQFKEMCLPKKGNYK